MIGLLLSLAMAGDLEVDSKVTSVVVYRDRARVTREASIDVPAGRTDLVFDGLPIQLLRESLSAEGEGVKGTVLTGIDMRPKRGTEDRDARVAELKKEREGLQDEVTDLSDVITRARGELAFLSQLQPKAPEKLTEATFLADDAPEQLAGLASHIGQTAAKLLGEIRDAERKQRDRQKEIGRIDRELATLAQAGNEDSLRVAVGLDAPRGGKVTVRLDYVVTGAGWSPHYDARYEPKTGKVRLDLSGQVTQRTGEDWSKVDLILSTARPHERTAPPDLVPFTLGQGYADGRGAAAATERVAAHEFAVRTREDVPSDGTTRRVPLTRLELKAEVIHQVVARRLEAAWLTATADNSADYALLAGPVSSYLGTAYVGEGQLPLVAPGEELALSFGVDDRVQVKRERLEEVSDEGKGLANRDGQRWAFDTTVKNGTGRPIQVRVHDQVPVSNEDVWKVDVTTTPEVDVASTGVFRWELEIPAGGEQVFNLSYEVTWPKGDAPILMD